MNENIWYVLYTFQVFTLYKFITLGRNHGKRVEVKGYGQDSLSLPHLLHNIAMAWDGMASIINRNSSKVRKYSSSWRRGRRVSSGLILSTKDVSKGWALVVFQLNFALSLCWLPFVNSIWIFNTVDERERGWGIEIEILFRDGTTPYSL